MSVSAKINLPSINSKIDNLKIILITVILLFTFSSDIQPQTKLYGDTYPFAGGTIKAWVEVDSDNMPLRVGLSLTDSMLSNLPSGYTNRSLNFPEISTDFLFSHVLFNWNPQGHTPDMFYSSPHLDFHFYIIPLSERLLIEGGYDYVPIAAEFIPEDYAFVPGEENISIFRMGMHFGDSLAAEFHGEPFTKTLIYGFSTGRMVFIEPMITTDYLSGLQNEVIPIKQPEAFQQAGYYPMNYEIFFDHAEGILDITLRDFEFRSAVSSTTDYSENLVKEYLLLQNYPNPFNPSTVIEFHIPNTEYISVKVYDVMGREVAVLVNEQKEAGNHKIDFDASHLSSGVYFYQLAGRNFVDTRKFVLMK
jgi:hypothetical protein